MVLCCDPSTTRLRRQWSGFELAWRSFRPPKTDVELFRALQLSPTNNKVANAQVDTVPLFDRGRATTRKTSTRLLLMDILDTSAQNSGLPRLLPISTVQAEFGLHRTTVYALVREGAFPKPIRVGRRYRWVFSEVQSWLNGQMAAR